MRDNRRERLEGEFAFRNWVKSEIESAFKPSQFQYIDLQDAEIIHAMYAGFGGWAAVIGHGDHGSYEWVIRTEGSSPNYERSDQGWGSPCSALREALKRFEA